MAQPTRPRDPEHSPVPRGLRPAKPVERRGIPVQPLWVLSVLIGISAAAVCLGVTALVGACPLPPMVVEGISFIVLVLTEFYLFRTCRAGTRWLPFVLLALLFPAHYLTGSVIPAMTCLSLLFCVGQSALLIAVCPKATMYRLPLLPLCAYAASLLICRDPTVALLCLLPFPAAAALAMGTRRSADSPAGPGRVGVICMTSLALGLAVLLVTACALNASLTEGLTVTSLKSVLDDVRTQYTAQLLELSAQLVEVSGNASLSLTEEAARNSVNAAINMIPAVAVIACNITALLAQCILFGSLSTFGYADSVSGHVTHFAMSTVSGITFLVAFILSLILGAAVRESTLAGAAAENIMLILQPGLALCGFLRLLMTVFTRSRTGCLPLLLFLFAPLLLTVAALLLSLYESAALVLDIFLARIPKNGGQNTHDGHGDDGTGGGLF